MSIPDTWLVFPDLPQAETRNAQLSVELGYPDPTGTYQRYDTPLEQPTSGQAAIVITTVCDCSQGEPYSLKNAIELLTPAEIATLQTWEEMQAAGWFPDDEGPP